MPDNAPDLITVEPCDTPVQTTEQSQIEIPEAIESVSGEMTTQDYELIQKAHEREEANEWIRFENAVVRYTKFTLFRYFAHADIPLICDEVRKWMKDAKYKPKLTFKPIKPIHNIDLRHYIWSIWVRLGSQNGHSGEKVAEFVMALFPEKFEGVAKETVKNLTATVKNEQIPRDEFDPDDRCIFTTVPSTYMNGQEQA